jgi:hypothetical protein
MHSDAPLVAGKAQSTTFPLVAFITNLMRPVARARFARFAQDES